MTIELRESKPRIWRRLSLPGDLTLDAVHTLFQAAMGWTDSHLHHFQPGGGEGFAEPYFITEFDEEEGDEGTREDRVRLDQVLRDPGDRLTYLYDFGDGWEHEVALETVTPLTADDREPSCLDGAMACPPEDVGGIWGHHEVAAWLRAGAPADDVPEPFEDAEHAHGWLPDGYDPDVFDADEATAAMRTWAAGEHLPWNGLPEPLAVIVQALHGEGWVQANTWLEAVGPRHAVGLDDDDVRRAAQPWLAVLRAVGSGTKLTAAGYLPPAVVEQIAGSRRDGLVDRQGQPGGPHPAGRGPSGGRAGRGPAAQGQGHPEPDCARPSRCRASPRSVATVLGRLPLGKGFEGEAGWLALLGAAAGESGAGLRAGMAQILTDRGWRVQGGSPVAAEDAFRGALPTLRLLESMAGGDRVLDRDLFTKLARATVFGVSSST